jgi:HPt (histidine-containing phosphotransfer) domain-containing protein
MESVMKSEYIDVNSAIARVGGNEALYKKLLAKFDASVDIIGFDEAIVGRDYIKAGEIVHTAKGVAGNLSLTLFFEQSSKLMDQLRGGGTPTMEDLHMFKQCFEETKNAVHEYLELSV